MHTKIEIKTVALLIFLLMSISVYSQKYIHSNNYNRIINYNYSSYPAILFNFYFVTHDQHLDTNNIWIFENNRDCELIKLNQSSKNYGINYHVIPDYADLNLKEITAIAEALESLSLKSNESVRLYSYDSNRINIIQSDQISSFIQEGNLQTISEDALKDLVSASGFMNENQINFVFIIVDDVTNRHIDLINSLINLNNSALNQTWFAILYSGKNDTNISEIKDMDFQKLNFSIEEFKLKKAQEFIQDQINIVNNSIYSIEFAANSLTNINSKYGYYLNIVNNVYKDSLTIEILYPDSLIEISYVNQTLEKVNNYLLNNKYSQASDYLIKRSKKLQHKKFLEKSKEIIEMMAEAMIKGEISLDTTTLFTSAESKFGFSAYKDIWYKEIKKEILLRVLNEIDSNDEKINERYRLALQLKNIDKISSDIDLLFLEVSGDYEYSNLNYLEAILFYDKYLNRIDETRIEKKLRKVLDFAIIKHYKEADYNTIYNEAKEYIEYFNSSFELRYIYGFACEKKFDFAKAITEYKWLINNWNKTNKVVTWNELYNRLKSVYANNFQFDEAILLNQRLYRQNGEEVELYDLIKNIRANYLNPVGQVLSKYISNVGISNTSKISNYASLNYPDFLSGIYLIDYYGNLKSSVYNKNNINIPKLTHSKYPVVINDNSKKLAWLIYTIPGNMLLVIEYSLKSGTNAQLLLTNIKSKKQQSEPWQKLFNYEKGIAYKFISQILAASLQGEIACDKKIEVSSYWSAIKSNEYCKYLVYHDNNGKILQEQNFKKTAAIYDDNMWEKSSVSRALFYQFIKYENNDVTDITNPIFDHNLKEGAIRIGFQ